MMSQQSYDLENLVRLFLSNEFDPFGSDVGEDQADADEVSDDENEYFNYNTRKLGRELANAGDEILKKKGLTDQSASSQSLNQVFTDNTNEEEAWSKFQTIMEKAVEPNVNPFKVFGAWLLTLHGLSCLNEGKKLLVNKFAMKFFHEKNLDQDITRMGGLQNFLDSEID